MDGGTGKDHVMSNVIWVAIPLLLAILPGAEAAAPRLETEKTEKPVCNAQSRGKLWPEKTGRGADTPIEMCAPKGWHFEWKQLTVDVSQLRAPEAQPVKPKEAVRPLPASVVPVHGAALRR
jgi:hypothetical protein